MPFYMNAIMKNLVLIFSAFKVWLEEMQETQVNHPRWEVIQGHLKIALEHVDIAFHEFLVPTERKQRKQLERMSSSSRVIVVSDADQRAKERVVEFTEEDAQYLAGICVWNECRMCEKNENQMKKCKLRYILKREGTKDVPEGFATGACEYSRL